MPKFSYRRMLAKELSIFRMTGRPMTLLVRTDNVTANGYTPGNLFETDTDATEDNLTSYYIFGKYEESDVETFGDDGRQRVVKGVIVVPALYRSLLANAEYIDPKQDGSRFIKTGGIVDEGRLFITQSITSLSLANPGDI